MMEAILTPRAWLIARMAEEACEVSMALIELAPRLHLTDWEDRLETGLVQQELAELIAVAQALGFNTTPAEAGPNQINVTYRQYLARAMTLDAGRLTQAVLKMQQYGEQDIYKDQSNFARAETILRSLTTTAQTLRLETTPCPHKMARVWHWLDHARQRGVVATPLEAQLRLRAQGEPT